MAQVEIFAGRVRALPESGRPSGIYKLPVAFPIALGEQGFAGDEQADRRVHGGPDKAVHLYPARHYATLARRFPELAAAFVPGSIGENISTAELVEAEVRIGDVWHLGTARLQVSQPRSPCWKIDERYGAEGIARFIAEQSITGWYWRVLEPGIVAAGDTLELDEPADAPTLREAAALLDEHRPSLDALERLARSAGMAENWREKIRKRLEWLKAHS